jgi:hypothetical protein
MTAADFSNPASRCSLVNDLLLPQAVVVSAVTIAITNNNSVASWYCGLTFIYSLTVIPLSQQIQLSMTQQTRHQISPFSGSVRNRRNNVMSLNYCSKNLF